MRASDDTQCYGRLLEYNVIESVSDHRVFVPQFLTRLAQYFGLFQLVYCLGVQSENVP